MTGSPTITGNSTSAGFAAKWSTAGTYTIKVMAVGDNVSYSNSDYSSICTINVSGLTKLSTQVVSSQSSVNINRTAIFTINPISNASSYTWNVTGSYTIKSGSISGGTASNLDLAWSTAGTYSVQCMAIGNGTYYTNSDWSTAKSISVTALPSIGTPSLSSSSGTFVKFGSAVGFSVTVPTGATSIKLSYTSNGSLTYCYNNANGTFQNLPSSGYVYSVIPGSTISYYFKADNYLGTSCNISVEWGYDPFNYTIGGKATFTININKATLPTPVITKSPNVSTITPGNSMTFSISAITNAGGYICTGLKNGIQQFSISTTGLSRSIGFTTADVGTWTIEYVACPSDTINYQNSAKSISTVNVTAPTKLATPVISGLKDIYDGPSSTYTISAIPNATSYTWSGTGFSSITPSANGLSCDVKSTTLGSKVLNCVANASGYTSSDTGVISPTCVTLTFNAPTVNMSTTGLKNGNVTITLTGNNIYASSHQWLISGSPTFVSGAATGTLTNPITVKWATAGTYSVQAREVGNGTTRITGPYSAAKTITIT